MRRLRGFWERAEHPGRMLRNKVPAVTALFWVAKLLTTAMGETTSDWLVRNVDPVLAVIGAFVVFAAALILQFAVRRYIPWVYWLAVLMVAVFGTMVADVLHVELGVPYLVSTVAFAVVLAAVFSLWYATQRTLSVHRIDTRPREFFYWCAVLATFALGTAVGDLTATTFGLGYLASGILFGILFAVPGIAYRWWGLGATAAFWTSYVLTRPFGASISDWLAVSHARGGLDLGTGPVSLVLFAGIVVCVVLMSARRSRGQEAVAPEATAAS
ncbi:MAG: COG4705 family protein [Leifsonia sp.]|uniref:COG4705 family protein n=1 Tax=Leifsonia sp. TaxID=1870902 RepID=UPI003F803DF0